MEQNTIEKKVSQYYTNKIKEFGSMHAGVDWNSKASQWLRFQQLLKVILEKEPFSIIDYGCGYGALLEYLEEQLFQFEYYGFDISREMLNSAKTQFNQTNVHWLDKLDPSTRTDYLVASGIFNVKLDFTSDDWEKHILETIQVFNSQSKKGFAFNLLSSYSDKEYQRSDLYYAQPEKIFTYCLQHFSPHVSLIHDYRLYEFTIIVRK